MSTWESMAISVEDPVLLGAATVSLVVTTYFVYILFFANKTFLPQDDFCPLPLIKKQVLSHDTVKFTFGLPGSSMLLGLPVGQHLSLRFTNKGGKVVQRSYTPVSEHNQRGQVSLVIKVYRPSPPKFPDGGQMSQHLDSLNIGDSILVKGPKGHVEYLGQGKFHTKPLGKPLETRTTQHIVMMAGGTGITPMLQVIHSMFHDETSQVRVKLLYANQTEDDILVREELEALHQQFSDRFDLWYTVDRAPKEWKYSTGFISKEMIAKHAYFGETVPTQFFLCGPPPMIKFACLPALKELGYSEKNWVIF